MSKERKPRLLVIQLDKAYQEISRIEQNCGGKEKAVGQLLWALKCAILLCDEAVEIVPAFLNESIISYGLFSLHRDILNSRYIVLKLREKDKQEYIETKSSYYKHLNGYERYSDDGFRKLLLDSTARIMPKESSRKYIESKFRELLSYNKITDSESMAIEQGLEKIQGKPLTWEVFNQKVIKKDKRLRGKDNFYKYFLFESYQNSIVDHKNTALITYGNYFLFSTSGAYNNDLYSIDTFEVATKMADIYVSLNIFSIGMIDDFKDTPEFTFFKEEYLDIIIKNDNVSNIRLKLADLGKKHCAGLKEAISRVAKSSNVLNRTEKENIIFTPLTQEIIMSEYYVSYAWNDSGSEREEHVNKICQDAEARGIKIHRDKYLKIGENLTDFMRSIGSGDRIFVFLSDKYLRSVNCMFELSEIWRQSCQEKSTLQQKIRVFVLDDANIWEMEQRLKYAKHWESEFNRYKKMITEHGSHNLSASDHEKYLAIQTFSSTIRDVLSTIADHIQPRCYEDFVKNGFDA